MEFKRLDKKVIGYWLLWRLILLALITAGLIIGSIYTPESYLLVLLVPGGTLWLVVASYTLVFPSLQHKVYKYYLDDEKLVVSKGILFRSYTVTPIIQVQDIGSFQGPIQMAFKISNVILTTAGSTAVINCLNQDLAKEIVDDIQVKIKRRLNQETNNATI